MFKYITDIKTSSFTFKKSLPPAGLGISFTFLVIGPYSRNGYYLNHKIYIENKDRFSNNTHHFSELFYRIWFTGWFHSSKFFSFSRLTGYISGIFQHSFVFMFLSHNSYLNWDAWLVSWLCWTPIGPEKGTNQVHPPRKSQ